jgi:hypothetical protein
MRPSTWPHSNLSCVLPPAREEKAAAIGTRSRAFSTTMRRLRNAVSCPDAVPDVEAPHARSFSDNDSWAIRRRCWRLGVRSNHPNILPNAELQLLMRRAKLRCTVTVRPNTWSPMRSQNRRAKSAIGAPRKRSRGYRPHISTAERSAPASEDLGRPSKNVNTAGHYLRSITTSMYSLGSTSVRSPERLRLSMRASKSRVKAACFAVSSALKALFIGP